MLSTVGMRDTMANFQAFNHLRVYLADLAMEKPGRAILFPQYRRERILTYASWRKGFWRESLTCRQMLSISTSSLKTEAELTVNATRASKPGRLSTELKLRSEKEKSMTALKFQRSHGLYKVREKTRVGLHFKSISETIPILNQIIAVYMA